VVGYGTTEIGGGILSTRVGDEADGTVGNPFPGTEIRIIDEHHNPVPPGVVGELAVRVGSRLGTYDAVKGKETQPMRDPSGWYDTGDLALMTPEGRVRIVGRKDDMVIRGGVNIYPSEVESILVRHPMVASAAVVGVPGGAGGERLWAFVERAPGSALRAGDLRAFCAQHASLNRVPDRIHFMTQFPRAETGEICKAELKQRAASMITESSVRSCI
jgi:acyl-CoA synthetase (AMP-forming)/AMP-acid ligase II